MYYPDSASAVKLTASPSFLMNNLSASPADFMCYVRQDEVLITQPGGEKKVPTSKCKIYQACYITLKGTCALAVLSNLGLQLWDQTGDHMVFYFPLNSLLGFESQDSIFMRGIACMREHFAIGCSTGNVLVFAIREGGNYPIVHNIDTSQGAISAVASTSTVLVAANDSGKIFGFSPKEAFMETFSFPGYGLPCTSLAMHDPSSSVDSSQGHALLLAGYASGHIRGFRVDIRELAFEITAHSRAVTALTLSAWELASCSQDQYLHVWALPDFQSASSRVGLLYSVLLENQMCTGCCFLGDRLCVAAYDEEEISVFRKVK